jgi:hypothetical protein
VPTADELHLDLDVQAVNVPPPPIRSVMPGGGVLMPAVVDTARIGHDAVVRVGEVVEHGDGPSVTIEGRVYRTSLSTTLTR